VAGVACLGEACGYVVRIGRALKVLEVASDASAAREFVVSVYMAVGADPWWDGVQTGQGESCGGVVEIRTRPGNGRVATVARRGEASLHVIGISRALIILHVTRSTGTARQIVVSIHVA